MADATITDNPTANAGTTVLVAGNSSTGTAPTDMGPGSSAALETALNNYLVSEIQKAKDQSTPTLPTPPADGEAQVIVNPTATVAAAAPGVPVGITILATLVGVASGVAYLVDRHHRKGKAA